MFSSRLAKLRPSMQKVLCSVCSPMSSLRALASQAQGPKLQFPALPPGWEKKYKPGEMYRHQNSIPKLPVPPLQQTLQKYLIAVKPLLTEEELQKTKAAVEEFGRPGGVGEVLQQKLLERAEARDSWLSEWWQTVAYMAFRLPVTVNVSPAIGYPRQPAEDTETYIKTAARHLLATVKWNLLIQTESLPPDMYREKPLCMSQYDMYCKTRIPCPSIDITRKTPINESRHVVVIRNGHFFKLDVLYEAPNGELAVCPPTHIVHQLHNILKAAPEPAEYPVGILTSEHRDTWFHARERLLKDPTNTASLDVIERAQSVFCLDKPHPYNSSSLTAHSKFSDSHSTVIANRCLHGNGSQYNSTNRWFDAANQTVLGEDGGCGSILEHSAADGVTSIRTNQFTLDLLYRSNHDVLAEHSAVEPSILQPAEKLEWNISPESARDIETAKKNLDSLVADVDLQVYAFTEFGKNFAKSMKLSPDGFMQIAIQLAHYKLYGRLTATYESAATRQFKYGRTDTIRSATNEALAFTKAMCDPSASVDKKADSLDTAVKAHTNYTNDAISGQAIDRHLLGLKLLAGESGMETPELYKDPAFARSMHFRLSTSQVPVPGHRIFLCFGAVVEDGYGVCYNPQETEILLSVSSFRQCHDTDSQLFGSKLIESLREMRDIMVSAKGTKSKL